MTREELASMIDHTLLKPQAPAADIENLCRETAEYGFASACVNSLWVPAAVAALEEASPFEGPRPGVCSVVGFPLGASLSVADEARAAVEAGAEELDMVIPLGLLKSNDITGVSRIISSVVRAAFGNPVKVIIETCYLTPGEKVLACQLAVDGGAKWVKTSTGFGPGGATVEDVALMKATVGSSAGVKASGGIRDLTTALAMIDAGAGRLGCSSSVNIVRSLDD